MQCQADTRATKSPRVVRATLYIKRRGNASDGNRMRSLRQHLCRQDIDAEPVVEGHPRQRGGARPCMDAAQPVGKRGGGRFAVRCQDADETAGPAGGDRTGLCVFGFTALHQLQRWG
jgi:hypothetical protein